MDRAISFPAFIALKIQLLGSVAEGRGSDYIYSQRHVKPFHDLRQLFMVNILG